MFTATIIDDVHWPAIPNVCCCKSHKQNLHSYAVDGMYTDLYVSIFFVTEISYSKKMWGTTCCQGC